MNDEKLKKDLKDILSIAYFILGVYVVYALVVKSYLPIKLFI